MSSEHMKGMAQEYKAERDEFENEVIALRSQNAELVEVLKDLLDKVHQQRMSWDQDDAHIQLETSFRRAEKALAKARP